MPFEKFAGSVSTLLNFWTRRNTKASKLFDVHMPSMQGTSPLYAELHFINIPHGKGIWTFKKFVEP